MKSNSFAYYLNIYFTQYLKLEYNVSEKTIISYNQTFKQLIQYLMEIKNIDIKKIDFSTINKNTILDFLDYLENKGNSINTRNQRLAAIKSFYSFCDLNNATDLLTIQNILNIKFKKKQKAIMTYLTYDELKQIFESIDITTSKGRRNYVILSLLYDSAARAEELINIKVTDLVIGTNPSVILNGKGNKQRCVPLMTNTSKLLEEYIKEHNIQFGYLFRKENGEKFNTKILTHIINKYVQITNQIYPSLKNKKISPHTFRHTKAMHLLESGVALIYIRDFLGHSSVTTTEIYVQVSDEIKRKVINDTFNSDKIDVQYNWNNDKELLEELLHL